MGAIHYRPAFPSRAFRRLPLLFLATLALYRCDFFDIFPPEIEIVSPKADVSYFAALPVEVKATDNRTVTSVEVFLNDNSVHEFTNSPYKTDISLAGVSSPATLQVVAYDQAGNHAEAERAVSISIGFRLTAPNGGETWPEQSNQTITWTSSGDVDDYVSLDYSLDGGAAWTQIVSSTLNSGAYSWTLPGVVQTETTCRVKVASTSTSYADTSDADFTITGGEITLMSPNGGEDWREWSSQTITWTSNGEVGTHVVLYYSLNEGATWTKIAASTLNDGSYSWTLPTISQTNTTSRVKVASTSTNNYDISDANFTITNWQPILVSSYITPGSVADVHVSGDYAYLAESIVDGGFRIINISDPANPFQAGLYDFPMQPNNARSVFVSGNNAYVTEGTGVSVFQIDNPGNPPEPTVYNAGGPAFDAVASGNYAFAASLNDWGRPLRIINLSDRSYVEVDLPGEGRGIYVTGGFCYLGNSIGIEIVNVTDPLNPTTTGSYDTPGHAEKLYVTGDNAYVADHEGGLQIINVSNPASPTLAGTYSTLESCLGVHAVDDYAFIVDVIGLRILDVSNPANPTLIGNYDTPGGAKSVFVSDGYAYVGAGDLLIFDLSGLP
ncbi:MAG: hypothetical protein J3T61_02780 [Candidatus Brocadiales bacterium]|nr:hypothetical protein [Candidatus Bathyanammoxibius sp.]